MPPKTSSLLLLIPVATAGVLLTSYLCNRPFSSLKSNSYKNSMSLSPPTVSSKSLSIINPRGHTDEELLARFTKGFFNGWIFTPERGLFAVLKSFNRHFIKASFSGIPTDGPEIQLPSELPTSTLPKKYTRLFNGNFLVLDHHVNNVDSEVSETGEVNSHIDIAFGDDRKGFAGFHRFEVIRENDDEVTIWFSSVSCNPSSDKAPFPGFVAVFHEMYAERLFWDGIRGVLRD